VLQCDAVCCSVLQCVAVCCSVLQCVAVCCSVLHMHAIKSFIISMLLCVAVCRSVLRLNLHASVSSFSGRCSALRCTTHHKVIHHTVFCSVLHHNTHCNTLQHTATHCTCYMVAKAVIGLIKSAPDTGLRVTPMIPPRNSLAVGEVAVSG